MSRVESKKSRVESKKSRVESKKSRVESKKSRVIVESGQMSQNMQKNPLFTGLVYINSELYGSSNCAQRTKLHELSFKIDVR